MRSDAERNRAMDLYYDGRNLLQISQELGIARATIRAWRDDFWRKPLGGKSSCCRCDPEPKPPSGEYVYLLGLYLGDGCISVDQRHVSRLRIACANVHPQLIEKCVVAMASVLPNKVGSFQAEGCVAVNSYSKHWPCLFPQHGLGKKHDRKIELVPWQQEMVDADPWALLRGLIHSDGCRSLNLVNGKGYVRYTFSNVSDDIKKLFTDTCDKVNVEWRRMNAKNISVARRASVELMDRYIGSKT